MAKPGYEKLVDVEAATEEKPRRFHSHFFNCFGNCDAIGWASCCFVSWCPSAAFGLNIALTTGKTLKAVSFALLFALLLAAPKLWKAGVEYRFEHTKCVHLDRDDGDIFNECSPEQLQRLWDVCLGYCVLSMASFLGLVLVGCINRRNTRKALAIKYDVDGPVAECCDDTWAWVFWPCGLCQETRTYLYNRVYKGEWRGPAELQVATV